MAPTHGTPAWVELTHGRRSGLSTSSWMDTGPKEELRPLDHDLSTEVCVIGAGISGLTTAYLLAKAGRKVVVIDDGPIGSGETGRTTAHLVNALDDRYYNLAYWRGDDIAKIAAASHTAAIDLVEKIVADEKIECDFIRLNGYLFQPDGKHPEQLEKELQAAQTAGVPGIRLIDRSPIVTFDTGPCLVFPNQAQFHPLKYLHGLAQAIRKLGGEIFTGSRVEKIDPGESPVLHVGKVTIKTHDVVHATNVPLDAPAEIYLKEFPYRTYVIAAAVQPGEVPAGLYWDNDSPYHYVRLQTIDSTAILIVGGEDHPTGKANDAEERYARLEEWARERFPSFGQVRYRWSGQVFEPIDGLGLIGPYLDRSHQYIITGDSGNGMTNGTLGGKLITDLILGNKNPWVEAYDPQRIPKAVKQFVKLSVPAASAYVRNVTAGHKAKPGPASQASGEIIEADGEKLAVYRDHTGKTHRVSAVCTHRGCIVAWNGAEESWDCPCHGSRFAPNGELLTGPAMSPLAPPTKNPEAKD